MKKKRKINKEEISSILYYVVAIIWFIAAMIGYKNGNELATAFLCLGFAMLSLGFVYTRKAKKRDVEKQDKKDRDKKEQE